MATRPTSARVRGGRAAGPGSLVSGLVQPGLWRAPERPYQLRHGQHRAQSVHAYVLGGLRVLRQAAEGRAGAGDATQAEGLATWRGFR